MEDRLDSSSRPRLMTRSTAVLPTRPMCPQVKKHIPSLYPYMSGLGSPMHYTGLMIKEADPTALTVRPWLG